MSKRIEKKLNDIIVLGIGSSVLASMFSVVIIRYIYKLNKKLDKLLGVR